MNWLKKNYNFQAISESIDELVILDATRNHKKIDCFAGAVKEVTTGVFAPLSAGGGIRSLESAELLLHSGADKVVLNTAITRSPDLVSELVNLYGSQCIVASVDYKRVNNTLHVFIDNGQNDTGICLNDYLYMIAKLNCGEVYLNSIDRDGTGMGYDIDILKDIIRDVSVPIILAGGAGNSKHLIEGINTPGVDATATANLLNFLNDGLPIARMEMLKHGVDLAVW